MKKNEIFIEYSILENKKAILEKIEANLKKYKWSLNEKKLKNIKEASNKGEK